MFKSKSLLSVFVLISLFTYLFSFLRVGSVLWGDALYYYAYTRSIVIDQDISFENEAYRENGGFPHEPEISEITGRITNKFSPGVSILWIPGFLFGQSIAELLAFFISIFGTNLVVDTSGYGLLSLFPVVISGILFSATGLYFIKRLLNSLQFNKESRYVLVLLFFTTPLFYYMAVDPVNSHPASFMLSAMLAYFTFHNLRDKIVWQKTIPVGLVAGALILVRNQDIVLTLPMAFVLIFNAKGVLEKLNQIVLFYGSAFVVFSIQLFFTLELYGLFTSPYLHRGESLAWFHPDFLRVLFSPQNGVFFFSPILLLALLTLLYSLRQKLSNKMKMATKISLLAFFLATYVIAAWGPEILGGPYGSRMFVSTLPYLSVGLAFFVKILREKYQNQFNKIFLFGCSLLTLNMVVQTLVMLFRF